jgi:hypothetical protein
LFAVGFLPLVLPSILHHRAFNVTFSLGLVLWFVLFIIAALSWWVISQFMVPAMYRHRCTAWSAFQKTLALITAHAAETILFILFLVVISIALAIVVFLAGILTCCIGFCLFAMPYIGTVALLPIEILLTGYTLLFLRQFGNDWDVWATLESPAAPSVAASARPPAPSPEVPPSAPPGSPYEPPELR